MSDPLPSPELDTLVYQKLTGQDIAARPFAGVGFDTPRYSDNEKDNKEVQKWLADNGWDVEVSRWDDETRKSFTVVIFNGKRRIPKSGVHSPHAFCLAFLAAAP